jgi:hypothetical protein
MGMLNSGNCWASHWLATVEPIEVFLVLIARIASAKIFERFVCTSPELSRRTAAMPVATLGHTFVDLDTRFQMTIKDVHLKSIMAAAFVTVGTVHAIATIATF